MIKLIENENNNNLNNLNTYFSMPNFNSLFNLEKNMECLIHFEHFYNIESSTFVDFLDSELSLLNLI